MPSALTYPGVYIEEVPSNVRTIVGASTSIAAFVGRTQRGPVNLPVVINSFADFERQFGGLWLRSPLSFAVRDFYLNGGGQAVIVRLFKPSFADETAREEAFDAATDEAQTAADAVATAATDSVAGATNATDVANAAQGAVAAASAPGPAAASAAAAVAAAVAAAAASAPSNKAAAGAAATAAVAPAVAAAADALAGPVSATIDAGGLGLIAAAPGSWADRLRVIVDHDVLGSDANAFNLTVRDGSTGVVERFMAVSTDLTSSRRVDHILEGDSALIRVNGTPPGSRPTASNAPQPGEDVWGDNPTATNYSVADGNEGSDGNTLTDADFTPPGAAASKTGLNALDKAEAFNLLVIPPHELGGSIGGGLIDAALAYCTSRRAVMIIDPPHDWLDKADALAGIDADVGSASANGVIYFPRILQPNPLREGREEAFVPSGAVAGLYARIDAQRGVWKAPAGLEATLVNAPRLQVPLTDPENGELNIKGINCLRALPGAGRVVWGARTRRGDDRLADQWKYVPVRRTALFIEESLYRGTQWVVFEPNDEPLWASIRLNVGAFMHGLFRQGAFQGATPAEAYFVKCDKDTTPQADIDKGIVNILVGFAPLKPAEFVVIKLSQITHLETA